jgi:outer membrane protein W
MKILLGLFAFLISLVSFSQQQAGDLALQFSGNFSSQRFEIANVPARIISGNIYVKVGKFFTQNLELGVKPNFFFTPDVKVNNQDPTKNRTTIKTSVGFGLYGAYSFLTANAKFNPYCGAEVNYLPSGDEAFVNLGPYIGVRYFVTERINIDANANWLINLGSTYGNSVRNSGLDVSPALNVNIGVGVVLGKIL